MGRPALTYAASGEGLAGDGPLLHRFLLARGRALAAAASRRDRDRAALCLRAARELAGRARDMDAVREASSAIDALARSPRGGSVGPARAGRRHGAADDGGDRAAHPDRARAPAGRPPSPPRRPRRKRRRAPRRPQRDLFDDFLAFLEKNL